MLSAEVLRLNSRTIRQQSYQQNCSVAPRTQDFTLPWNKWRCTNI